MKLDIETIKKLGKSIEEHNLSEISLEIDGAKITMKKEEAKASEITRVKETIASENIQSIPSEEEEVIEAISQENLKEVTSPMVGTFYSAASPELDDFVKIGDKIEVGDTVCIIEAMKMMNEVKSTESGTVVSIKGGNGNIVKKGDILFLVK
ncbi:acetyl-CoA carboxylase biotin carboxyl carrier protein [uncultured Cetobacterium sp.]|uniref:acetyl-CoA carboxylase biotin carboxyl carrier protein n=1 Tax=uncultured Cetobacterium sp. TaxID=527638 RepID=UPI00262BED1D|nr:acetyl-CoA carboxylase biotin carboxyl carrier protein [uncultured Cetobacterium sp.]